MSNITITNVDQGNVILRNAEFRDDLLTFGGAGTVVEGTILARDSVSGKLVPFVKGGITNENGIPKAVITSDVTAAGAGDEFVRVAVCGEFRKERLVIDADGDDRNIDNAVMDQLRDYGLVPINSDQLLQQDNQ